MPYGERVEHQWEGTLQADCEIAVVDHAPFLGDAGEELAEGLARAPAAQAGDAVGGADGGVVVEPQALAQADAPGQAVGRDLVPLGHLRVRAEVDERFVRQLAAGQAAEVYGRNLAGGVYRGRVCYVEQVMGDKTVFTRSASERKDVNVLQVVIDMVPDFRAPPGLQVDVRVHASPSLIEATTR